MLKRLTFGSLLLLVLVGCKYSRYVPDDRYLLWENEIDVVDGGSASSLAEGVLRQETNNKLVLSIFRPGLAIYSWGNGEAGNFWSKLGVEPVIYDEAKANRSATLLQQFYFNEGYFQAQVKKEVEYKNRKALVKYNVVRGPRYRIDSISFQLPEDLEKIRQAHQNESQLEEGSYYSLSQIDLERIRLKRLFRNMGYYDFSEAYISFDADTNAYPGRHRMHLKMLIQGQPRKQGDSIVYLPIKPYYISKVSVIPDFNFQSQVKPSDSTQFLGYNIKYNQLDYLPRYLTDAIHFKSGDLFKQENIEASLAHYSGYKAFNVTEVNFKRHTSDSGISYLDAEIRLAPQDKRSFNTEFEVTNTSGNYGMNVSVGVINRNLFKGGEALSFKINGGLEYQPTLGNSEILSRTLEYGAELRVDFPRFLLPFNTIGLVPKRMRPRSNVSFYFNRTNRVEFDRETFGARLSYEWNESVQKTHQFDLIDISFSNILSYETSFIDQLDRIQRFAFTSEFISSTSWKFTYTGQKSVSQKYYDFFSSELELGGNLQSLFVRNFGGEDPVSGNLTLLEVPAFQFARVELDYRYYIKPSRNQLYVFRINGGYVLPYGISQSNSNDDYHVPPFSRFFFIGGTNDLRAWPAYRAGGGIDRISSYADSSSNFAIGTLKLLSNIEYRFPLLTEWNLKGAVFLDAGNIWLTGGLENESNGFALKNLARDLYLGSGFGLRLDLDFFVIRLDLGLRVRDPGYYSVGDEWVIATKPVFNNITYNIALGYPF